MAFDIPTMIKKMESSTEAARQANLLRKTQIESIYQEIIERYRGGGAFEAAGLAEIEKGMKRGVGREAQQMISSGLYGTTTGAQVGQRWEESYAQPARLKLEDIMAERLSGAQTGMAGFLERIEEPYPDYASMMPYLSQAGGGGGGGAGGGGYGAMTRGGDVSGSVGGTTSTVGRGYADIGAPASQGGGAMTAGLQPGEKPVIPQPLGLTANQLATGWGIGRKIKWGEGVTAGGQTGYLGMAGG